MLTIPAIGRKDNITSKKDVSPFITLRKDKRCNAKGFFTTFLSVISDTVARKKLYWPKKSYTYNSLIVKIYKINDNRLKAVTFEGRGQKVLMAPISTGRCRSNRV